MKKILALVSLLIMLAPISVLATTQDHGEGHICFRRIDADKDDLVTPAEFAKFYPHKPQLFEAIDQDKDGKITHDEYEEYWYRQEG